MKLFPHTHGESHQLQLNDGMLLLRLQILHPIFVLLYCFLGIVPLLVVLSLIIMASVPTFWSVV